MQQKPRRKRGILSLKAGFHLIVAAAVVVAVMFRLGKTPTQSTSCWLVQSFQVLTLTKRRYHAVATNTFHFNSISYKQQQQQQQHQSQDRARGRPSSPAIAYWTRFRRWQSSSLQARFQVGDAVLVQEEESSTPKQGIIQDIRGRGWYTIRINDETFGPSIVKYRGNQLRRLPRATSSSSSSSSSQPLPRLFLSPQETVHMNEGDVKPLVAPPPPPPTIIHLDQALREQQQTLENKDAVLSTRDQIYLQQVAHHATFSKWVIFTDLHCSPSSLKTCLEVLQHVHHLAVKRNAGVLFLGDWWHHRGTLRIDCVNAVLDELSTWRVPMILIPGNHDQVTLGGHSHGLTVLENAYRVVERPSSTNNSTTTPQKTFAGPLVFSYPTLFQNALFIPHIRDNAIMESVLLSPEATKEATCIFCHVDAKGALMNDMIQSEGGVAPYLFPSNIPIYSGHFHKPHIMTRRVNDTPIEYLGSPYQTTLSEAQQQKALVVVDASRNWTVVERIPIDFGPRYWKAYSVPDLLRLEPGAPIEKNDRIILTISKENMEKHQADYMNGRRSPLDTHIKVLRYFGASVEIRPSKFVSPEFIGANENQSESNEIEEMMPSTTWKTYLLSQVEREAITNTTLEALLRAGLQVLDKIDERDDEEDSPVETSRQSVVNLQLHNVKIEGFGPFHKAVSYPLHNRGLVLVRGTNKDGGSDSNGSGKSSLAMAALWALTGSIDPRPTSDSKAADIINDNSKVAKVSVSGLLNGMEFTITRMKASSRGQLSFLLGGKDLTTQAAKETQQIIDEKLGVGPEILARTMFHGQHTMNGLLEASDAKLKEELSLVVPLELWQEAVTHCRTKAREASKKGAQMEGMLNLCTADRNKLEGRLQMAKTELDEKQESLKSLKERLEVELQWLDEHFNSSSTGANSQDLDAIRIQLDTTAEDISQAVQKQQKLLNDRDNEIQPIRLRVDDLTNVFESLRNGHLLCERDYDLAQLRVETSNEALKRIESKWNVKLGMETKQVDLSIPLICPTCQQPIEAGSDSHSHDGIKEAIEADIFTILENARTASSALAVASSARSLATAKFHDVETQVRKAQDELKDATTRWDSIINEVNNDLAIKRVAQEVLSKQFATAATSMQRSAAAQQLEVASAGAQEAVKTAFAAYNLVDEDYKEFEAKHQELTAALEEEKKLSELMSDLVDAFGPRGVQAFVLQTAVDALQSSSQTYLNELSDGSIQLRLSIDAGDRISRAAFVRTPNGEFAERPLGSLSGGQWRRCSMALSLGFADLVATRGRMRPSLCVFDEPLTFLDTSGRVAVGKLLRSLLRRQQGGVESTKLSLSTVLVILQDLAAEELEEAFDRIDEVVKEGGTTTVNVDEIEK